MFLVDNTFNKVKYPNKPEFVPSNQVYFAITQA